jgi:hypothetical protein
MYLMSILLKLDAAGFIFKINATMKIQEYLQSWEL